MLPESCPVQFANSTATPIEAGSAALPSWINGWGPTVLLFDFARPETILLAIAKNGSNAPESDNDDGMVEGGGREFDEKTEYSVALSSSIVCARVPNSQLFAEFKSVKHPPLQLKRQGTRSQAYVPLLRSFR